MVFLGLFGIDISNRAHRFLKTMFIQPSPNIKPKIKKIFYRSYRNPCHIFKIFNTIRDINCESGPPPPSNNVDLQFGVLISCQHCFISIFHNIEMGERGDLSTFDQKKSNFRDIFSKKRQDSVIYVSDCSKNG